MKELYEFLIKNKEMILTETLNHIWLVGISTIIGLLIALPLGVLLSRKRKAAKYVLAIVGAVQTIPGLVLLGFAMLLFGVGTKPALVVLTLYAILPTLHNTYTGIVQVDKGCIESAKGIGFSKIQTLFKIELPLALPSIAVGFRMSVIYIISWATLAGLIGAGGLGDLIWTGLATYENNFIITGAVLAALLAIVFGAIIGAIQNLLTPRGLKVGR
jgi:osmoprotectant transport system permease protein